MEVAAKRLESDILIPGTSSEVNRLNGGMLSCAKRNHMDPKATATWVDCER
jgi:hypothetical protein